LKNDGRLQLFFIGVGSTFASTLRQTNFLIIKGDTHIQIDYGMTGPSALLETAGLKTTDIGNLSITHSHADHAGGVEAVGLLNRYVGQKFLGKPKIKLIITEEYQNILWDRTLRGGMEYNEEEMGSKRTLGLGDYSDIVRPTWKTHQPRQIFELDFNGIHLEFFRTKHIPDTAPGWEASFISYGLFIDEHVFVSVDTRFDRELIDMYANKSTVMFHDVQFFPEGVHAPLDKLRGLPDDIKRKMRLMHYSDDWAKHDISDFAGWVEPGVSYIFD
jgi:ribonuclease BN (tRNA processing enzyme)